VSEELPLPVDQLLAGFDFAQANAAAADSHRRELESVLLGFVGVVDSLHALEQRCRDLSESGLEHIPARAAAIIVKQALQALQRAGATPMNCIGQPLDLALHEVVDVRSVPGVAADTIVEEVERGYVWRNRTLRQAKVVIAGGHGIPEVPADPLGAET
jgi:molecular chaperone GrpE